MKKQKIILVSGKKRVGKDTFSKTLKGELQTACISSNIFAFAEPVKQIMAKTFQVSLEDLDAYKNSGDLIRFPHKLTSFRELIQNFGTEAMQETFGKDVWVNVLREKIRNSDADIIIISDFRFLHEDLRNLKEFKDSCISVLVYNDNDKHRDAIEDSHISENALKDYAFDYKINNTNHNELISESRKFIKELENARFI